MLNLNNIRSIAVVGASTDTKKLGSVILQNILAAGYKGFVYPINPNYKQISGLACFADLTQVPGSLDLVVVVIPAAGVLSVASQAATKNTKHLIVISAGFAESGEVGKQLQASLVKICTQNNMNLIGPNCLGVQITNQNINASFGGPLSKAGGIALISQSGAIITAVQDMAKQDNLGFSHIISLGNKAGLNENDLLIDLIANDSVAVIAMYLEDFVDGNDFVKLASNASKPIVVLKPGVTAAGALAASSHTGALVSNSTVISAGLEKAGVFQVSNLEQFYILVKLLNYYPELKSVTNVSVITNAGGPGVMFSDLLTLSGVNFAQIGKQVQSLLKQHLPASASLHNPIDILGDADAQRYLAATSIIVNSSAQSLVIVMLTPQYVTQVKQTAEYLSELKSKTKGVIIGLFLGGMQIHQDLKNLELSFPIFNNASALSQSLGLLTKAYEHKQANVDLITNNIKFTYLAADGGLPADQVLNLLNIAKLQVPKQELVSSSNELQKSYDWPMVVKADSSVIAHKTEQKAVVTNIHSLTELKTQVNRLIKLTGKPVLVQQQIVNGLELFVGINRDGNSLVYTKEGKGFGHLLTVGVGGIYTELIGGHTSILLPANMNQILLSLQNNKAWKLINGYRSGKSFPVSKVIDTIYKLQQLVLSYPQINILEVNPLILTLDDCYVVDAKVWIKE